MALAGFSGDRGESSGWIGGISLIPSMKARRFGSWRIVRALEQELIAFPTPRCNGLGCVSELGFFWGFVEFKCFLELEETNQSS